MQIFISFLTSESANMVTILVAIRLTLCLVVAPDSRESQGCWYLYVFVSVDIVLISRETGPTSECEGVKLKVERMCAYLGLGLEQSSDTTMMMQRGETLLLDDGTSAAPSTVGNGYEAPTISSSMKVRKKLSFSPPGQKQHKRRAAAQSPTKHAYVEEAMIEEVEGCGKTTCCRRPAAAVLSPRCMRHTVSSARKRRCRRLAKAEPVCSCA